MLNENDNLCPIRAMISTLKIPKKAAPLFWLMMFLIETNMSAHVLIFRAQRKYEKPAEVDHLCLSRSC